MQIIEFISDERGISSSVFKLALAVIVFAAILALIVSIIKPMMETSRETGDTIGDVRETRINQELDRASE